MRHYTITPQQQVVNRICAKQEFTYPNRTKRYVVGVQELHSSENPSLNWDTIHEDVYYTVGQILVEQYPCTTIGQWFDEETGKYVTDMGITVDDLNEALGIAKDFEQKYIWDAQERKTIKV